MTTDRAVLLSVIFHLVLIILLMVAPLWEDHKPKGGPIPDPLGLVKLLSAPPSPDPIPVQFFPSPGAPEKAPGKAPRPSDANRQAHGGDPKLPKAETPKSVSEAGIQDLAKGAIQQQAPFIASMHNPTRRPPDADPPPKRAVEAGSLTDLTKRQTAEGQRPDTSESKSLTGLPNGALTALRPDQVAPGDGGGGFSSGGGFVDSGPIAFDTAGYDWGAYAAEMIRKIKRNWDVPALARYGVKGWVRVRFFIRRDGTVEGAQIVGSSGVPPFDNSAFQAIVKSSPLRPLPADLGVDREGVTITFFYNIDPSDFAG